MIKTTDPEINNRIKIATDTDHNFFVEASAGSGKTTSLVYRMVTLVEKGVPVEKICTITFTKAAANEFFERFQKLLSIRSGDEPDDSDDYMNDRNSITKERCQKALNDIDLCFLGTIDGFCNMIAHEMPAELKIPSSSTIISDAEFGRFVQDKYYEVLRDTNHKLHDLALRFNKFVNEPFEAFSSGISKIMDFRNLEFIYDATPVQYDFDTYFDNTDKHKVINYLTELTKTPADKLYTTGSGKDKEREEAYDKAKRSISVLSSNAQWCDITKTVLYSLSAILNMNGFSKNAVLTNIGSFVDPLSSGGRTYYYQKAFVDEIEALAGKINDYSYAIYFEFLQSILKEVTEALKKEGKFQHFDFLLYLRNAFKESAEGNRELINHVYERHKHFLLDESQDTNPLQTELFFYLTGKAYNPDWKQIEPEESSLFIVGDPKQSIYGFRGADVKAYLENKKIFQTKNQLLELTRNFRSHAHLKEWFNDTFDNLLNYTDPAKQKYALRHNNIPIDPTDETLTISLADPKILDGVYRYMVHATSRPATDNEEVAKLVLDIKKNKQIYRAKLNKQTKQIEIGEPSEIQYDDFLISPRSSGMEKLVEAFNFYNIPVIVEGKVDFKKAKIFKTVLDLTFLLKEPKNKLAFNNVIYSDLFKLNYCDNIQMMNDGFNLDISNPAVASINFTQANHKQIIDKLRTLYEKTYRMSFSSTMLFILNDKEFNVFEHISFKDLEYIYFLVEKIKEGEENGSISTLEQLKQYVDLFVAGSEERILRFQKTVHRVKIANVHKVKGLQAPIVILAKPYRRDRPVNQFIDCTATPPYTKFSFFAPEDFDKHYNYVETTQFKAEEPDWNNSRDAEEDRLRYVAATRAEAALIICQNDSPTTSGYWARILNQYIDRTLPVPSNVGDNSNISSAVLGDYNKDIKSEEQSFKVISPSQIRHHSFNNNDDVIDDALFDDDSKGDDKASIKGTMIHKLMECIVSSNNKYNIDALIEKILSSYGDGQEYRDMLHNVANTIQSGGFKQTNSHLDKDILKTLKNAKKVWCETPFSYLSKKGNIVNGIIDLIYEDQEGKYHVIDYKTNKESDVSILEDKNHYADQLQHYIDALAKNKMPVVDAHIYHIDIQ